MKTAYKIEEIEKATGGTFLLKAKKEHSIYELLLDSRKLIHPAQTLFFAISGVKQDGHNYLEELYQRGVRNFIITKQKGLTEEKFPDANFILVKDAIRALQKLAAHHRNKFRLPVIAVTGSNGKTVVKEWLYQLLHEDYNIVRSPKSYNSQTGVPLSLWLIDETHNLGIFEAGISEPGEMEKLEKIIRPTIGVFTNVGEAHNEGFLSMKHKTKEKLNLFVNSGILVYCKDYFEINQSIAEINALSKRGEDIEDKIKTLTWSMSSEADVQTAGLMLKSGVSYISLVYRGKDVDFEIPFTDKASIENAIHCACVMLYLKKSPALIRERMKHLTGIQMRLEMKDAVNNCSLINDSYNSDIVSLKIAIDFLKQQNQHPKKTVILSDILQSGRGGVELYSEVANLLNENKINRLIGIGPDVSREKKLFEKNAALQVDCFKSTDDFLEQFDASTFQNEVILLKGARKYQFEIISKFLEKKAHETVLEINLNAIAHNLKTYHALLKPETKIMVMVKALSYGSGSFEIANVLQFNHADYLAVAYADEGLDLRKNGITLPVMVMNPEVRSFETILHHNLESNIYSLNLFDKFSEMAALLQKNSGSPCKIHIELETGMNRLGIDEEEIPLLIEKLKLAPHLQLASVFSHLAASEDKKFDDFTQQQISLFEKMSQAICREFPHKILRHILNSNGITRHAKAQFDMVRLGLGLYGIDSSEKIQNKLLNVSTLKTVISQIKSVKKGETVGYGRAGKVTKESLIATVGLGYADGLSRKLSNGEGKMLVNGKPAPIIGNVCMDMTMLDITGIEAREGDEVIVFGPNSSILDIAAAADTIPYEILTGISGRVKRVYFQE